MTEALVEAGACGFKTVIRAKKEKEGLVDGTIHITIGSGCKDVMALSKELNGTRPNVEFLTPMIKNVVLNDASKYLKCTDCAVPWSILKAVKVEMGFALPKDVSVRFSKEPEKKS